MGSRSRRSRRALPRASRAPPATCRALLNPVSSTRLRSTPTCPRPIGRLPAGPVHSPAGNDGDPHPLLLRLRQHARHGRLQAGCRDPGPAERRGWSGSAVKDLAISENGFSPPATYEADRKAFVAPYTTRAYQPGPIPAGTWTAELGLAQLGAASVAYKVDIETTGDPQWANQPYARATDSGAVANPTAGWYAGDVHAHGEQEPGNALVSTSLDYAFKSLSQGGAGLDWIGLVDHNNDVSRARSASTSRRTGKLVIPGTEVTTYHGHYNSIGSSAFPDFRGGPTERPVEAQIAPGGHAREPVRRAAGRRGRLDPDQPPDDLPGRARPCRGCPWD